LKVETGVKFNKVLAKIEKEISGLPKVNKLNFSFEYKVVTKLNKSVSIFWDIVTKSIDPIEYVYRSWAILNKDEIGFSCIGIHNSSTEDELIESIKILYNKALEK